MPIDEGTTVKIERDILNCLDTVKKGRGLTGEKQGKQTFQGPVNRRREIQNLKRPQSNEQPQKLYIADFVRLCGVLHVDPARVLSRALENNNL